jgi:hypothetical protein
LQASSAPAEAALTPIRHSSCPVYGFGSNKRIVLYDTLLSTCTEEEVVAVLAHGGRPGRRRGCCGGAQELASAPALLQKADVNHLKRRAALATLLLACAECNPAAPHPFPLRRRPPELGHWKLRHVPTTFALGQLLTLAQFSLFAAVRSAPGLYESFGFTHAKPAVIALVLFGYLSAPIDEVLHVVSNAISRRFEFQADAYALGLGMGRQLRSGLLHLEGTNKVGTRGQKAAVQEGMAGWPSCPS